jgi:NAD(P)-dependent dehydrogenase (short-subunit alcohol dehydrogenase family)
MANLTNKTALVTGASRGIGRATASVLAKAGAHVLVHYGHSAPDAESIVADIRSKGGRADAIRADLGTPDGATLLAEDVRSIVGERLDVLVSNAGISKAATIKDHTVEDFDNLFATNVRSPFFLVQQLLPLLGEGSNIIVISSVVSSRGCWQARSGQRFDPCLRRNQGSTRDSCQELGRHSWAAGHPRKRGRARRDRHRDVKFHEDRGGA